MRQQIPVKLYICQWCHYQTDLRWVLARHLTGVHRYSISRAKSIADESEYHLNPSSWSVRLLKNNRKEEREVKKVRTLKDIVDELEEKNVGLESAVINPKEISITTDDEEESEAESEEE
jgi:hypothetical protein